jgi:putative endonuclease
MRRGMGFGDPLEAVTPPKQAAVRALAERYLSEKKPDFDTLRFDVVGILVGDGTRRIVHIEDAF